MVIQKFVKTAIILSPNPGLRQDLKKVLHSQKVNTLRATGKFEIAKTTFEDVDENCDLVILDLKIEDGHAGEIIDKCLTVPQLLGAHIIVMASKDEFSDLGPIVERGISGYILKPFKVQQLPPVLTKVFSYFSILEQDRSALATLTKAQYFELRKEYFQAATQQRLLADKFEFGRLFYDLGRYLNLGGEGEEAFAAFKKAISLQPDLQKDVKKFVSVHPLKRKAGKLNKIPKKALDVCLLPDDDVSQSKAYYGLERLKSVLIHCDDISERRAIAQKLKPVGLSVIKQSETEEKTLEEIEASPFDLFIKVIRSKDLSAMSFYESLKEKKNFSSTRSIFIFDSVAACQNIAETFSKGVNWVLVNPVTASSLRYGIHNLILQEDLTCLSGEVAPLVKASFCHISMGDFKNAAIVAKQALSRNPKDGICLCYLAISLQIAGDLENSKKYFGLAVERNKDLGPIVARVSKMDKFPKAS